MLLGAVSLTLGVRNICLTRNLRRTGAKTYGQVVRHKRSDDTYSPVVAWQTPDGRRREFSPGWYRGYKGRFKVGARVSLHYDPADPHRAVLDGYDGAGTAWSFVVAGAVALGFGLSSPGFCGRWVSWF
jgi:hypothetical protein